MTEPKFKTGDKVRILDGSGIEDYCGLWSNSMKKYVGKETVIIKKTVCINKANGYFAEDPTRYYFDERGLELIEPEDKTAEATSHLRAIKETCESLEHGSCKSDCPYYEWCLNYFRISPRSWKHIPRHTKK